MKTWQAYGNITRRMVSSVGVRVSYHRKYQTFEELMPLIELKWRILTRSRFDDSRALWDDMLQEAYIACWKAFEKGRVWRDEGYITVAVKHACMDTIRKNKAMHGGAAKHGVKQTVLEYAVSDIVSQDDEDSYGDSWLDRQPDLSPSFCPESDLGEDLGQLVCSKTQLALNRAVARLGPIAQQHLAKMTPYLAPDVTYSAIERYTGLSRNIVSKTLRDLKRFAQEELSAV